MATATARAQEFMAQTWIMIRELLRIEAATELQRDAEIGASEDYADMTAESRRWFGNDVGREEHQQLTVRKLALEVALKQADERLQVAQIREVGESEAEAAYLTLDYQLAEIEQQLWSLEDRVLQQIEARRAAMVLEKADALEARYLQLSKTFPMNVHHPAVPHFLRRWIERQRTRGALAVDCYRLLAYLVLRDTIFTGVMNVAAVIEDEDLPIDNPLAKAGLPRSKSEQRMNLLLAQQFQHENGDRRVDRGTQLTELHEERIATVRQGRKFTGRFDFEAGSDYYGLPTLKALVNPDGKPCRECGGTIRDNIVVKATNEQGQPGWRGATECDCTVDYHTPWTEQYDDAMIALLQRTGHANRVPDYLLRVRRRRAERQAVA